MYGREISLPAGTCAGPDCYRPVYSSHLCTGRGGCDSLPSCVRCDALTRDPEGGLCEDCAERSCPDCGEESEEPGAACEDCAAPRCDWCGERVPEEGDRCEGCPATPKKEEAAHAARREARHG